MKFMQDYKFPKKQLRTFYNTLPDEYKVIFLMLASSGLRVGELLNAEFDPKVGYRFDHT